MVTFPRAVREVAVGILGYATSYVGDDHHLGRLQVEVAATIDAADATKVEVVGDFQLRDYSGTLDDSFAGNVQWALVADLVPAVPPVPGQPRPDLLVVDAERTQAVQHFRGATQLATPNVFPDNSIRLVADKPTVVRLYVDYDATSGLPPIATLTGQLMVTSGGVPTTVLPMESITPRRDAAVLRGERRHTLNFLIPENLCRGTIAISAQVRDAADPMAFSPAFQRTLSFDTIPTVNIQAVGINYTGPDTRSGATPADLAAPTQGDFVTTFALTENLYPTPQVQLVSFQVMDYDEEITSDISQGCDKFSDLLDTVSELGADDGSIVYGLYNVGVDNGTVGGCGGGGAAVGKIGRQTTAAHEIGHALGRQHAPCDNVTRCASPHDQDVSYPHYSGFDSDSIGEHGFDVVTSLGAVKPPSTWHDMMGYSPNKWVSPYTYKALLSAIPAQSLTADLAGGAEATARSADHGEWEPARTPLLFLRVDRSSEDDIVVGDCFTYPSLPRPHGHRPTDLFAELRAEGGHALVCARLYAADTCGPCHGDFPGRCGGCAGGCAGGCGDRGPVRIRQAIAFEEGAHELVLLEGRRVVYRREIGAAAAPILRVEMALDREQDELLVRWSFSDPDDEKARLLALVQWQGRDGTWRGVGPRTRRRQLLVPKALVASGGFARLRVLVTTGLATATGEWEGRVATPAPIPTGIELTGADAPVGPRILRASTATNARDLRWYADGAEVASGRLLDTRLIPPGTRQLSARAADRGTGAASAAWKLTWAENELTAIAPVIPPGPPRDRRHARRDHQHPPEQES